MNSPLTIAASLPDEVQESMGTLVRTVLKRKLEAVRHNIDAKRRAIDVHNKRIRALAIDLEREEARKSTAEEIISSNQQHAHALEAACEKLEQHPTDCVVDEYQIDQKIREVVGRVQYDDKIFVSVFYTDSDGMHRFHEEEVINRTPHAKVIYDEWKQIHDKYKQKHPNGAELATIDEFKKAIDCDWKPDHKPQSLYPTYWDPEEDMRIPFKKVLRCYVDKQEEDIADLLLLDGSVKGVSRDFTDTCPVANYLTRRWWNLFQDLREKEILDGNEIHMTYHELHQMALSTPISSPEKLRKEDVIFSTPSSAEFVLPSPP